MGVFLCDQYKIEYDEDKFDHEKTEAALIFDVNDKLQFTIDNQGYVSVSVAAEDGREEYIEITVFPLKDLAEMKRLYDKKMPGLLREARKENPKDDASDNA